MPYRNLLSPIFSSFNFNPRSREGSDLREIKSVNDILKNPDVRYEEKGLLIRSVVDQIVYDKEEGKMYFDIIVS